jgi:CheY-like chemotaxis protein
VKKILIIDDEEGMRKALRKLLEASGFEVIEAENGIDGISRAKKDAPDLILLDIAMPELDGIEVCKRIKEFEELRKIPILMVSSMIDRELVVIAIKEGASDFVAKPVKKKELLDKINKYL